MTTSLKFFLLSLFILPILWIPSVVVAEEGAEPETAVGRTLIKLDVVGGKTGFGTTAKSGDVGIYNKIALVINILLGFAGLAATILIIVAGIRWITAGGNEEQITNSKNTIKGAIIGLVVVLAAFVIVNFLVAELLDIFASP